MDYLTDTEVKLQWFPGHMTKTRRMIQANLKLIDIVVEIVDARVPYSSRNPELKKLINNKPLVTLLNKSDLADDNITNKWISWFDKQGIKALKIDVKSSKGCSKVVPAIKEVLADKIARQREKGIVSNNIRVMVLGIPNVGKSSVINRLSGQRRAKVEDRPGVTRGKQWIKLASGLELLDTPGVLWPKFKDQNIARNLAFTGAIRDQIIDTEWLSMMLLEKLVKRYPQSIETRYKVDPNMYSDSFELLEAICRKRGMLMPGNQVDTLRGSVMILDEFRGAKLGRISLESPDEVN